ncbi:MAG: response regulator transcription factor [Polyangiaceae bacterium]
MARVLLVDDDPSLLDVLSLAFTDAGHDVVTAADGKAGLALVERGGLDLVVTDVNLPHMDGFSLVRELRAKGHTLPVVLLTSRDTEVDEVLGLDLGADDFVSKPFSTRALLARVGALLRRDPKHAAPRQSPPGEADTTITHKELAVDPERLTATYGGKELSLTLTEHRILEAFVRRPGRVLSRAKLLELGRGDDGVVDDRLVDTYVRRLRRKIEAFDPSFEGIETVVGAGYRLRA